MKTRPTPEELHKLLDYAPDTGILYWKTRTPDMFEDGKHTAERRCKWWNSRFSGKEALNYIATDSYKIGAIFNIQYLTHQVIWAMVTGAWAEGEINHINHNRSDNRFNNLQEFGKHKNAEMSSSNTSGVTGVCWDKSRGKWRADIEFEKKQKSLGRYTNKSDAIAARKAAEFKYGFHPNHGLSL